MFPQMLGPVTATPGVIYVDVWNCRATVARYRALTDGAIVSEYASNGEELAEHAEQAVYDQGGGINLSGAYWCPPELAARAQWASEEKAQGDAPA